jgi:hypothetical protein
VRVRAYQIPSESYRELEAQILEQLRDSDREQLMYLLGDHDLAVDLLSGEWGVLFDAASADYYVVVDWDQRRARMAVSPDELPAFVEWLRDSGHATKWAPISFGLAELVDALPRGTDLVGLVFAEESDDWLWAEHSNELMALRPEVWTLIEPHAKILHEIGDHAALARLCADHCEGAVEFSDERWKLLLAEIDTTVPELRPIIDGCFASAADYSTVREAIAMVADPQHQPSLDAWLRVHADGAQYVLYFRDREREKG